MEGGSTGSGGGDGLGDAGAPALRALQQRRVTGGGTGIVAGCGDLAGQVAVAEEAGEHDRLSGPRRTSIVGGSAGLDHAGVAELQDTGGSAPPLAGALGHQAAGPAPAHRLGEQPRAGGDGTSDVAAAVL